MRIRVPTIAAAVPTAHPATPRRTPRRSKDAPSARGSSPAPADSSPRRCRWQGIRCPGTAHRRVKPHSRLQGSRRRARAGPPTSRPGRRADDRSRTGSDSRGRRAPRINTQIHGFERDQAPDQQARAGGNEEGQGDLADDDCVHRRSHAVTGRSRAASPRQLHPRVPTRREDRRQHAGEEGCRCRCSQGDKQLQRADGGCRPRSRATGLRPGMNGPCTAGPSHVVARVRARPLAQYSGAPGAIGP